MEALNKNTIDSPQRTELRKRITSKMYVKHRLLFMLQNISVHPLTPRVHVYHSYNRSNHILSLLPNDMLRGSSRTKVMVIARHIEKELFQNERLFSGYSDIHTLEKRIKAASISLLLKLLSETHKRNDFVSKRKKLLLDKVGKELFDEIFSLASEINNIKRTNDVWTKTYDKNKVDFSAGELPLPLRSIYFRSKLSNAVSLLNSKTSCLHSEYVQQDWLNLVEEARVHLKDFREFEKEVEMRQSPKNRSSCCSFGCFA